ncbi:MAG: hypothetical protein IJW22_03495 [Clostridia bacterium]|nr:hypothetical protein [Clostridia bacterium]
MKKRNAMSKKGYYAVLIFFGAFFLSGFGLCVFGITFIPPSKMLLILGSVLIAASFGVLLLNFKRMRAFEVKKIMQKIYQKFQAGFEILEMQLSVGELPSKLLKCQYKQIAHGVFQKRISDGDNGDRYYRVLLLENVTAMDFEGWLEHFEAGWDRHNLAFLFWQDATEENMQALKEYLRQTAIQVSLHRFRCKKFYVPLVIAQGKIYYIKLPCFGVCIAEAKRILRKGNK